MAWRAGPVLAVDVGRERWNTFWGMKVKTSVTLERRTVAAVDALAGPESNRSRIIEQAVVEFLERHRRAERERRDLAILDRSAEALNEEVEDVLAYQAEP